MINYLITLLLLTVPGKDTTSFPATDLRLLYSQEGGTYEPVDSVNVSRLLNFMQTKNENIINLWLYGTYQDMNVSISKAYSFNNLTLFKFRLKNTFSNKVRLSKITVTIKRDKLYEELPFFVERWAFNQLESFEKIDFGLAIRNLSLQNEVLIVSYKR